MKACSHPPLTKKHLPPSPLGKSLTSRFAPSSPSSSSSSSSSSLTILFFSSGYWRKTFRSGNGGKEIRSLCFTLLKNFATIDELLSFFFRYVGIGSIFLYFCLVLLPAGWFFYFVFRIREVWCTSTWDYYSVELYCLHVWFHIMWFKDYVLRILIIIIFFLISMFILLLLLLLLLVLLPV